MAAAICLLTLPMAARAGTVTWTGGNMTWSQPDTDSFNATYNSGDTAVFDGIGQTATDITIDAGGVTPGAINVAWYNWPRFNISMDNGLGTGLITLNYSCAYTFKNTKGSELALANNITLPNGSWFWMDGGSFRFTGTVTGGANPILFTCGAGYMATLENGVAGAGTLFDLGSYDTGGYRINGASSASCRQIRYGIKVQIGANNVFGPAGTLVTVRENSILETVGGAWSLDNGFDSYGMTLNGAYDLVVNGSITNLGSSSFVKKGTGTLVLNGDNSGWGTYVEIYDGVLRAGHANALGRTGITFFGGVLELGASDLNRTLQDNAPANSTSICWRSQAPGPCDGGFSAYGGDRSVTLDAGSNLTWGSTPGFVPSGKIIIFGSTQSNAKLIFQNPIDLNSAVRTIRVNDNTNSTADRAVLAGVLSGTGSSGITKTGDGTLFFNATNTYSGITTVSDGAVGGNGQLASNLVFNASSGFVADWSALSAPLTVLGSVDLSNADALTVLGTPPAKTRTVILTAAGGITGTFDTLSGLSAGWTVDYSVAGEVALKPSAPQGTMIQIL